MLVAAVGVVPLVQRSGLSRNEDRAGTEPLFQSCPEGQNRTRAKNLTNLLKWLQQKKDPSREKDVNHE